MDKYFWAQVNANKRAYGRYFYVSQSETLEEVVSRHFYNYEIVDFEEVTKEYAEKNAKRILQ